jgi:SAM-dependent methyltransferase
MTVFGTLDPAEQARQLANPEGTVGLAVAEWLNSNNREGNAQILAMLDIQPGCRVLEIGFGNGRAAADVIGQADEVRYDGIDLSPTMVDEARRHNAALDSTGRAAFHLACAEHMPFDDCEFDRAFSIGVAHFWKNPVEPLRELLRVMRPGGLVVMGALDSRAPPPFARPEYGFHLRSATAWEALFRAAGFGSVAATSVESVQTTADGVLVKRHAVRVMARR